MATDRCYENAIHCFTVGIGETWFRGQPVPAFKLPNNCEYAKVEILDVACSFGGNVTIAVSITMVIGPEGTVFRRWTK